MVKVILLLQDMNEKALLAKIDELERELKRLKSLPDYEVYVGMLTQIGFWNDEMKSSPVSIKSGSEEDTRAFDKTLKYMESRSKLYADMDSMRLRFSPELLAKAETEVTSAIDQARLNIKQIKTNAA